MKKSISIFIMLCYVALAGTSWAAPAVLSQGKLDKAIFTAYTSTHRVAATATALAANGTNCETGQAAGGVDASGNAEGCFAAGGGATIIRVDATAGNQTYTMAPGGHVFVVKTDSSANTVTIAAPAGYNFATGIMPVLYGENESIEINTKDSTYYDVSNNELVQVVPPSVGIPPTRQVYSVIKHGTYSRAANKSGTYSRSGTTVTVTCTTHGLVAGDRVYLDFTSGTATDNSFAVITATANTFTITHGTSGSTSGAVTVRMPIIITVTGHGCANGETPFIQCSSHFNYGGYTVYQTSANTFQLISTDTDNNVSGPCIIQRYAGNIFTWTKPTGCKTILVEMVGAGGAGGTAGCGGGYASKLMDATALVSETVTVGLASMTGGAGGTSSFGALLSATGGATTANGLGGVGIGGDINMQGGASSTSMMTIDQERFNGGLSYLSTGNGYFGSLGGGFGTGGNDSGTMGSYNAYATAGIVIITEFY